MEPNSLRKPSRKGFVTNYPNFRYWKKTSPGSLLSDEPINIYVHIPFCLQRCAYCYYKTYNLKGRGRNEKLERYVTALCQEIELTSNHFNLKRRPVISIYFGGGTPTILKGNQLHRIVEALHLNFSIDCPEFTVEAEPVTFTKKMAEEFKELRVNRISLGVQSLCDEITTLSNRLDTKKKALEAIERAKETGAIVNIDLLSGLAGETKETWAETVENAISTDVESITVYKMELFANTDYFKSLRKKQIELPSDEQELEFMEYSLAKFEQGDYIPWSFFTFTKKDRYKNVYASSIWTGADCCAIGASSFGNLGKWLYQNTSELEKYLEYIESGALPINRGYHMTHLDEMLRAVALGMKLVRLDLSEFQRKYGFKFESLCGEPLEQLEAEGFVRRSNGSIEMTSKGILYGDYIGKQLCASLEAKN